MTQEKAYRRALSRINAILENSATILSQIATLDKGKDLLIESNVFAPLIELLKSPCEKEATADTLVSVWMLLNSWTRSIHHFDSLKSIKYLDLVKSWLLCKNNFIF